MELPELKDEEELYRTRLLNVEEKPFKRITKRLATLHRTIAESVHQEKTPPPEARANSGTPDHESNEAALERALTLLNEEIFIDFAAFDASIARLRSLAVANARERARYVADQDAIRVTCDDVRSDMVRLRAQLAVAQTTLEQRKGYDALAEPILNSRTLRARPDQRATIRKIEDECRQLEAEAATYTATWRERKEQFSRIMDESMRLRRLIRDEKEEVERREGMDDEGDGSGGGGGTGNGNTTAAGSTTTPTVALETAPVATETGEAASATAAVAGGSSPDATATADGVSPAPPQDETVGNNSTLNVTPAGVSRAPSSRGDSRAVSPEVTPNPVTPAAIVQDEPATTELPDATGDDVDMAETDYGAHTTSVGTTQIEVVDAPVDGGDKMDTT